MTNDEEPVQPASNPDLGMEPVAEMAMEPAPAPSPGSPARGEPGGVMSLVDHLAELRNRIVGSILGVAAGAVVGFAFGGGSIPFLPPPPPTSAPPPFTR